MRKVTKMVTTLGLMLAVSGAGVPVSGALNPLNASAATTKKATPKQDKWDYDSTYNYKGYRRISKWAISSRYKYKVANKKGKTYTLSGRAHPNKGQTLNTKLKATHALKNYKKSTWTRKKITQVKHKGKWMMYYYVTTKKNHAGGWVKLTDLRLVSPRPNKAGHKKDGTSYPADFDTQYRAATQAERNRYVGDVIWTGAAQISLDGQLPADIAW